MNGRKGSERSSPPGGDALVSAQISFAASPETWKVFRRATGTAGGLSDMDMRQVVIAMRIA